MKMMNKDVCLVIPVYNEEKVIKKVVKNALSTFPIIVCINDGSTDRTKEEILKTDAILINHAINMGQGAALQTGIEFAQSIGGVKKIVTFDADGQHRVEDVVNMLEYLNKEEIDIVFGSRFLGQTEKMPTLKKVVLKVAIKFSNFISGIKLTDTHNGLRAFNLKVAKSIQITMSDMAHASEILEIIRKNKFKYVEVPVKIVYTEYSLSKGQSIINAVNIAFDILLRRITNR